MEDTVIDFDALNEELDLADGRRKEDLLLARKPCENEEEDDLLGDLLNSIEEQEVKDLGIEKVLHAGITSDQQADYFIRRIKELQKKAEEIDRIADEQIKAHVDRVNEWRLRRLNELSYPMEHATSLLETYAAEKRAKSNKKTFKLIEGSFGFHKQQELYEHNDDKLRDYLISTSEGKEFLENLPPKVKWGELRKAGTLGEDGIFRLGKDALPGVIVTRRPDKFVIK